MLPDLCLELENLGTVPANELRIRVASSRKSIGTVFFRTDSGKTLKPSGDALLCLGLVPAMELGCDLRIGGEVDRGLLNNAREIQNLLCSWYPGYRPIRIDAEAASSTYPAGRGTALFFSGGVDSSYSLAETHERLHSLITLVGADVPLSNKADSNRLVARSQRIARAYNLDSVVIETNAREIFRPFIGWIEFHGSAMAAIRHLLSDDFDNVLIASSGDQTARQIPWGSHPRLDPLFGTPGALVEHHGLEYRLAKIARIVSEPALMRELRICNKHFLNCGICSKCTMAMSCLSVLDALDKAPTFPAATDGAGSLHVTDDAVRADCAYLRTTAAKTRRHARLVEEIDRAIAHYDRATALHRLLPLPEMARRLKRVKHRLRYWRATL